MFFSDKSVSDTFTQQSHLAIVDAITRRRDQGAAMAVHLVSRLYGLKERRVVQFLRNQVRRVPADEYFQIQEKRRVDLDLWAKNHDAQAAKIRELLGTADDMAGKEDGRVLAASREERHASE